MAEFGEEIAQRLHGFDPGDSELGQLARILAVVREIVVTRADAFDRGAAVEPASMMVIKRVESVFRARWVRSKSRRVQACDLGVRVAEYAP
jgi:hypothetical protein